MILELPLQFHGDVERHSIAAREDSLNSLVYDVQNRRGVAFNDSSFCLITSLIGKKNNDHPSTTRKETSYIFSSTSRRYQCISPFLAPSRCSWLSLQSLLLLLVSSFGIFSSVSRFFYRFQSIENEFRIA